MGLTCQSSSGFIEPGDPDRSWLFIKLTAAHDADGNVEFTPDESWDPGIERRMDGTFPPSECPNVEDGELTPSLKVKRKLVEKKLPMQWAKCSSAIAVYMVALVSVISIWCTMMNHQ